MVRLSEDDIFTLSLFVMSPSQLEIAATVLLQSLKLTINGGVGKGPDGIDVRGSIRHYRTELGYTEKINSVLKKLKLLMGENIDSAIVNHFDDTATLTVQCKNYSIEPEEITHPTTILFTPRGELTGRQITLESILSYLRADPVALSGFNDWLNLVKFNYLHSKKVLGLSPLE